MKDLVSSQEDEAAQINGVCMVAEMSNVGLDHVKHFERKYGQLTAAVLQVIHLCILDVANNM